MASGKFVSGAKVLAAVPRFWQPCQGSGSRAKVLAAMPRFWQPCQGSGSCAKYVAAKSYEDRLETGGAGKEFLKNIYMKIPQYKSV